LDQNGDVIRLVEVVHEIAKEIVAKPRYLFDDYSDDDLTKIGVPQNKMSEVRNLQHTEEMVYLVGVLEEDVWDALEALLNGIKIAPLETVLVETDAEKKIEVSHYPGEPQEPRDSGIRLMKVDTQEELEKALEFPLEQWVVFLHPTQREIVEREFNGPVRVYGSAGTGKTVVALHRAAYLARKYPTDKILLTTYSRALAARLGLQADILMGTDSVDRKRLTISNLHSVAVRLLEESGSKFNNLTRDAVTDLLKEAKDGSKDSDLSIPFLESEWDAVIDPWGIKDWDRYRNLPRAGRSIPLGARKRKEIWDVYEKVLDDASNRSSRTFSQLCRDVAEIQDSKAKKPYDHVIVDESQDFGPTELFLLRSLVKEGPDDLMLCGDNGQRIYKSRASWKSFGINVVGRSRRLRINYRTSEEIRRFADSILPGDTENEDGEPEKRGSVSLFRGPVPKVEGRASLELQSEVVVKWIEDLLAKGYKRGDLAVFGRTWSDVSRIAEEPLKKLGIATKRISEADGANSSSISIGTMHVAKGLEFPAVALVACSSTRLPLAQALNGVDDPSDKDEVIERERHLLYVAATRARENLIVTYTGSPSGFLPKS